MQELKYMQEHVQMWMQSIECSLNTFRFLLSSLFNSGSLYAHSTEELRQSGDIWMFLAED